MITAVDTDVLIDLFLTDAPYHSESRERLRNAYRAGGIIICDIVYAELAPGFSRREDLDVALSQMHVRVSPIDSAVAWEAGSRWRQYRRAGGPRARILADFLIGAHALSAADVFLTRDRGFFETYFPDLRKAP